MTLRERIPGLVILGTIAYVIALSLWAASLAHAGQGGMSEAEAFVRNGNRDLRYELRLERFCSTQVRCKPACGRSCWTEHVRGAVIERRP